MANKKTKTIFYRLLIAGLLLIIFCIQACHSSNTGDQQRVLDDYAKAACALQHLGTQRDSVSKTQINTLELQISALKNEYENLSAIYDKKINTLNKEKYEAGMKADEASARITKEHEARFGHTITPAYEREMNAIENKKNRWIKIYDQQIETLTKQRGNDQALREKTTGIDQLKNKITAIKKDVQSQFDIKMNESQKQSEEIAQRLNKIITGLPDIEKQTLIKQIEIIKTNPCKQWK